MTLTPEDIQTLTQSVTKALEPKFEKIDQRFEQIDRRFVQVDRKFVHIDQRFDKVDQKFDRIDQRFETIDEKFDAMDERFQTIEQRFVSLDHEVKDFKSNVEGRFDQLEKSLVTMGKEIVHNVIPFIPSVEEVQDLKKRVDLIEQRNHN